MSADARTEVDQGGVRELSRVSPFERAKLVLDETPLLRLVSSAERTADRTAGGRRRAAASRIARQAEGLELSGMGSIRVVIGWR